MDTHLKTGRNGEDLACDWLLEKGFSLLARNWKSGRREIDIIAMRQDTLHFIEVKTRRADVFGMPEAQVKRKKLMHIQAAATDYLEQHPQWRNICFDIISVLLLPAATRIDLFEDIS